MKAFWEYCCDFGHRWHLTRDSDSEESDCNIYCHKGHEAVTLRREVFSSYVEVAIHPASRMVNEVTRHVDHEYEFFIVVRDIHGTEERFSQRIYSWSQTNSLLEKFRNVSPNTAWRILDNLDSNNYK
ncbi:hypothetical protein Pla110_15760 [Polystyrenella longa]|uniref:Uncharacterized protein n=1 Tax=Polystyrenella longa TaxID=2528007 RepID=A0A518CKW1_9PLAN|nr:hypothetical protein Pla110_15760 [Polystyrenella longa]